MEDRFVHLRNVRILATSFRHHGFQAWGLFAVYSTLQSPSVLACCWMWQILDISLLCPVHSIRLSFQSQMTEEGKDLRICAFL